MTLKNRIFVLLIVTMVVAAPVTMGVMAQEDIISESEPNNDQAEANPIETGQQVRGVLDPGIPILGDDVDYFAIQLEEGQEINATFRNYGDAQSFVATIFSPSGREIRRLRTTGAGIEEFAERSFTLSIESSGTYYVQIEPVGGTPLYDVPYEFTITTGEETSQNSPPDANAGDDQAVGASESVQLSGEGSTDSDGDELTYSWSQASGPEVSLENADTATPSFTAPDVDEEQTLTFALTVSDGETEATDTVNVTVQPEESGAGDAAYQVANIDAPSTVVQGEAAPIAAEISNTGDAEGAQNVTLQVDGETVQSTSVELSSGESTTVTFDVATGDIEPGTYTYNVVTENDSQSIEITVEEPPQQASFEVSNLSAPPSVAQDETVTVSAEVTNTGEMEGTQEIEFRFAGETLQTENITLGAGESTTVTFEVATADIEPGTYTHGVFTENDSQTVELTIEEPAAGNATFEVAELDAPRTVTQGDTVTISATITNTGDAEDTQEIGLRADGETIQTKSVTLEKGASTTVEFSVSTEDVEPGTYTHTVTTANDSQSVDITVEAEEPEMGDASVEFTRQESNGTTVTVDSVTLENGGYVVIHAPDGEVLGHSKFLEAGAHEDVTVELDTELSENTVLTAMAHTDDGDQEYEFGTEEGADGPYLNDEGEPVTDDGCIIV